MRRRRKTIQVDTVRERVNLMLAGSPEEANEARLGAAQVLESILHETGNYKGFSYLDGSAAVARGKYDETRRRYY